MKYLLLSSFLVVGCVEAREVEILEEAPPYEVDLPGGVSLYFNGEQEQGRFVLGRFPDSLETPTGHFRIPGLQQGFTLSVKAAGVKGRNGSHLVADEGGTIYEANDPWFNNRYLYGPGGIQLKIRSTATIGLLVPNPGGVPIHSTVYFLDYWHVTPAGASWVNYCGEGKGGAIPIQGYFDHQRTHHNTGEISFSCIDGTGRKCNAFGYTPGNAGPGDDNWDFHQACIGMTSALYCGDGEPFTYEKTPILIRDPRLGYGNEEAPDLEHPAQLPGDPDRYYIEAGWLRDGRPLCLSRLRWKGLAKDACGTALVDPRFHNLSEEVKFCDQWEVPQLFANGAVLVNASKAMDITIERWRNGAGDDVTTVRGFFTDRNGDGVPDGDSIEPFSGYNVHVGVEGMLLRNLPGSLIESDMRPLFMLPMSGDLTLDDAGAGRQDPRYEGYAFHSASTTSTAGEVFDARQLRQCKRGGGDHDAELGDLGFCSLVKSLFHALPPP